MTTESRGTPPLLVRRLRLTTGRLSTVTPPPSAALIVAIPFDELFNGAIAVSVASTFVSMQVICMRREVPVRCAETTCPESRLAQTLWLSKLDLSAASEGIVPLRVHVTCTARVRGAYWSSASAIFRNVEFAALDVRARVLILASTSVRVSPSPLLPPVVDPVAIMDANPSSLALIPKFYLPN